MVNVDISTLSDGLHEIDLSPAAEDLDLDPETFSSIQAHVRLDIGDRQILCRIDANADALLVCDRTLEPFVEPIVGDYTVVFTKHPDEITADDESIVLLDPSASSIDVTAIVRDTLLLSIPLRKVAPAARDAELQLQYGGPTDEGDAIDPRWDALRKLKTGS